MQPCPPTALPGSLYFFKHKPPYGCLQVYMFNVKSKLIVPDSNGFNKNWDGAGTHLDALISTEGSGNAWNLRLKEFTRGLFQ